MHGELKCIVLDAVYDDFYTIWEILSIVKSKTSTSHEEEIVDILYECLKELLDSNQIATYEGTLFQGEEKIVDDFHLTKEFILSHINDWNSKKFNEKDIRFYITERGRSYYEVNCTDVLNPQGHK